MVKERVYRGEIYYIRGSLAIGCEQKAEYRPAIIVSNNTGNKHSPVVEVVYLTTKEKNYLPTHVQINSAPRSSIALCEQISTVHKGRIGNYAGRVTKEEMQSLDKAIALSVGLIKEGV